MIKAKATDGVAESNYSSLEVSLPRTKAIFNTPFVQRLLHFQCFLLIIKQLMKV